MQKFKCSFPENYQITCCIELPSTCPHCGRSMSPKIMFGSPFGSGYMGYQDLSNTKAIMNYRCTYEDCMKFFIVEYSLSQSMEQEYLEEFTCHEIKYSYTPKITNDLPNNICQMFPDFTEIYNQSLTAEHYHLNKISGIGYRKALEFLIKSFAIQQNPLEEDNIKGKFLGKVISENLSDLPRVQKLAKAANWISTDEVHYEQRFTDSDIESMKHFIKSAATFISASLDADEAEAFIIKNDPKK